MDSIYTQAQEHFSKITSTGYKKMYFMGIKGVGMTALAVIAKQAGFTVGGCDVEEKFITDSALAEQNIAVDIGFNERHLQSFIAESEPEEVLVIITGAHGGFDNPIAMSAKEKRITVVTQGQAVGLFMAGSVIHREGFTGISVCGSHGKTTISSMIASALYALDANPTYVVGTGEVFPIGLPGTLGSGKYFIAEADEYASDITHDRVPKLYYQHPQFIILNNIDFDHPDFYENTDAVYEMFKIYVQKASPDCVLLLNGDDERVAEIIKNTSDKKIITYGEKENNDYSLRDFTQNTQSSFSVYKGTSELGTFSVNVPGVHNALNSLPVIALCQELGFDVSETAHALSTFKGSKRRSEIKGSTRGGAVVIDDYAHHPQEITTTLSSLRTAYPDKKIVCIFQSHTYSRTKALLHEFAKSFRSVDEVVLLPVFSSARETSVHDDISDQLYKNINEAGSRVEFMKDRVDVIQYIAQNYDNPDSVIVTMGAGSVYLIGEELVTV